LTVQWQFIGVGDTGAKELSMHNLIPATRTRLALLAAVLSSAASLAAPAQATTLVSQLDAYVAQNGQPASAQRGQQFFTSKHGQEWSCASCHGQTPTGAGKHASTGKTIAPLAPAFEPTRFTDAAKTEKWFRRNCKDVLSRECTPAEKADVMAFLATLK
jgi:mono/diheme cytochrome c family protein